MEPVHVLVVFYSRGGSTEKLALAAAVGAVQKRALIRLRRLPDATGIDVSSESSECQEEVARMRKEYVTPKEADVVWADGIISVIPTWLNEQSPECTGYFDLLKRVGKTA